MSLPLGSYRGAVMEGRFLDAAQDHDLQALWRADEDRIARTYLLIAAGLYEAGEGSMESAKGKLELAIMEADRVLEDPDGGGHTLAGRLRRYAEATWERLQEGRQPGALPLPDGDAVDVGALQAEA